MEPGAVTSGSAPIPADEPVEVRQLTLLRDTGLRQPATREPPVVKREQLANRVPTERAGTVQLEDRVPDMAIRRVHESRRGTTQVLAQRTQVRGVEPE
jgi:hypothetical protein